MSLRWTAPALASVAINAGLVAGLVWLDAPASEAAAAAATRVPLSVLDAPPPPPPPRAEPSPAEQTEAAMPLAAPMPAIDLPPVGSGAAGVPVAAAGALDLDWDLGALLVGYGAKGPASAAGPLAVTPARLLYEPDLSSAYPRRARNARLSGQTLLDVAVGADGRVQRVEIISSSPPGVFERAAKKAASRLRYEPSKRGGRPQASRVKLELDWRLED